MRVREPIIILGSPRSGTTMLGNLLATHPDVAYWEEPRTIWSLGRNAWRRDDRLTADNLDAATGEKIDARFHRFLERSGRDRLAEKTPSNTLRVPFIHALYPDARIVHLIRDGRPVVASLLRMLEKPPDRGRLVARLRETPPGDLPALVPVLFRDVIVPRLTGRKKTWWGPRPPGWQEWSDLPVPVRLARQWKSLVTTARTDLRQCFPEAQWMEIKYETFVADPLRAIESVCEVAGLRPFPNFDPATIRADRSDAWRETLDAETIALIESETGSLLSELGYSVL